MGVLTDMYNKKKDEQQYPNPLLQMDPMDVEYELAAKQPEQAMAPEKLNTKNSSYESLDHKYSDDEKQAAARFVTGAAPTLMGFLFGGSPLAQERSILEGQKYYDESTPKKTVLTRGPNGQPIYTDIRESIGKEAFQKPINSNQQQRLLQSRRMADLDKINDPNAKPEEKFYMVRDTLNGPVNAMNNESLSGKKLIDIGQDTTLRLPTAGGGVNFEAYNKVLGTKKNIASAAGAGEIMGTSGHPLLKKEAESLISSAQKGRGVVSAQEKELAGLEQDRQTLSSTQDPMVFATKVGQALRSVEKRLSEEEQKRFMGDDYKGLLLRGEEHLKSKYGGTIPDTVRANIINLIDAAHKRISGEKRATEKAYGPGSGLSTTGQKAVNRVLGKEGPIEVEGWKNNFRRN